MSPALPAGPLVPGQPDGCSGYRKVGARANRKATTGVGELSAINLGDDRAEPRIVASSWSSNKLRYNPAPARVEQGGPDPERMLPSQPAQEAFELADLPRLRGPRLPSALAWLQAPLLVLTALLPLVVLPGLERPFSTPKLVLLGIVVCTGWAVAGRQCLVGWRKLPGEFRIALAAWLGALGASAAFGSFVSPAALFLPLLAVGWFLLVMSVRPRAEDLALALLVSGAVVACVALFQFSGADPFALAGWGPAGGLAPRMRVYATLGNPNFVAAFLVGVLPVTFFWRPRFPAARWLVLLVLVAEVCALLATGSRSVLPGLGICLVWLAWVGRPARWRQFVAAAVLLGVLAVALAPSRPLATTLRGRFYTWRISAPHATERVLFGWCAIRRMRGTRHRQITQ